MNNLNWTTEKPEITDECVLLTATKWAGATDYKLFTFEWLKDSGERYLALCDEDGFHWGDYEDLEADFYAVIKPL